MPCAPTYVPHLVRNCYTSRFHVCVFFFWRYLVALNTIVCSTFVFKALTFELMQPSKLDQMLGLEIQHRRTEKGWSQEYLAEMTGLHRTYISQLERGLKSPSVRVLSHITNALGVTMSEFIRVVEESLSADRE